MSAYLKSIFPQSGVQAMVMLNDMLGFLQQDYTAIMIAILRQMTDSHYTMYLEGIPDNATHQNLADFLTEIIMVFQDLIKACVFPPDWNEMIMVQNQVFLKVCCCLSSNVLIFLGCYSDKVSSFAHDFVMSLCPFKIFKFLLKILFHQPVAFQYARVS